ncbi:rod shape-determining protein RodA [Spirochaeta isovalerica]|uniref:Peptidoglycan glycosyltransferase RodA n=1 Tax=Spirochaeta isovalerica TaxID=150 RepID=A0A841R7A9_9SPIO|nr:rod shape-determining protein RodA [Spirochaeta isovalerica]MBB6479087.1 rod shape determining protein RodA [Spirochaeta isovalerica]
MAGNRDILKFDVILFATTLALMLIGIFFIYSSGVNSSGVSVSNEWIKQIIWVVSSLAIIIFFSLYDYARFKMVSFYIYLVMVILLLFTLFFGRYVNGARSWLGVGPFGIQPAEFSKIAVIFYLGAFLDNNYKTIHTLKKFIQALVIIAIPMLLTLAQPDFGSAIVNVPIFLVMLFLAGARLKHIIYLVITGSLIIYFTVLPAWSEYIIQEEVMLVKVFTEMATMKYVLIALIVIMALAGAGQLLFRAGYYYWIIYFSSSFFISLLGAMGGRMVLKGYQIMRLIIFIDPQVDPQGAGWNMIQSITAVGAGGLWGRGFLQGTQSHLRYLPQQSSDFIFSIFSEEAGFVGAIVVFSLYILMLVRSLIIIDRSNDRFGVVLGGGIVGMIFFHVIINTGMAIGVMPITGIPLFFLSYGGSSLWTASMGIGILLSIYQRRYRN